jgi:bacillithiol system protein YtxJ
MLTHLHDLESLEAAIEESRERPVLLFKHSRTCGISCEAYDELHSHLETGASGSSETGAAGSSETGAAGLSGASGSSRKLPVYKVITVQSHRQVSDVAATRLGVRHETPQAILLRDGKPVWKASHFRITAAALADALTS